MNKDKEIDIDLLEKHELRKLLKKYIKKYESIKTDVESFVSKTKDVLNEVNKQNSKTA